MVQMQCGQVHEEGRSEVGGMFWYMVEYLSEEHEKVTE